LDGGREERGGWKKGNNEISSRGHGSLTEILLPSVIGDRGSETREMTPKKKGEGYPFLKIKKKV